MLRIIRYTTILLNLFNKNIFIETNILSFLGNNEKNKDTSTN